MTDDYAVAAGLRRGGEEFRSVMDSYWAPLMGAAVNILGNREDAEDACQETFVQIFRNREAYDPARSFRNWIFAILYRRCIDILRKKRRSRDAAIRLGNELPRPARGQGQDSEAAGAAVPARILALLSARERAAVALWAGEGFSAAEISAVLGCSASTARVTLFNARRKLKSFLENNHGSF